MRNWVVICVFSLLIFVALFALACAIKGFNLGTEIGLPLLAIAGVMALLGALAVVAISFSLMSMSDRTQALGLPNGSVRAVIALSLVVLFAILTVFLFSALHDDGRVHSARCVRGSAVDGFVRGLGVGIYVGAVASEFGENHERCVDSASSPVPPRATASVPTPDQAGAAPPSAPAPAPATGAGSNPPPADPFNTVYFRDVPNAASEDFAKQLLVLIGTLVTSVCGFYFGSKATSDAQENNTDDPPNLVAADPGTIVRGGPSATTVKIVGTSLNSVKQARMVLGDTRISDGNVVSNAGQVIAHFGVAAAAPVGAWDVVVTDTLGREARLAQAITVGDDPGAGVPADDGPKPTGVTSGSMAREKGQVVTVTGTGLLSVNRASLSSGEQVRQASNVKSSDTSLDATFDFDTTDVTGNWDLTLTDKANKTATLRDAVHLQ